MLPARRLAATASLSRPQTRSMGLCSWALYLGSQSSRKRACSGPRQPAAHDLGVVGDHVVQDQHDLAGGVGRGQLLQEGDEVHRQLPGPHGVVQRAGAGVQGAEDGPLGVLARGRDAHPGPLHPHRPDDRQQLQVALVQVQDGRRRWPAPGRCRASFSGRRRVDLALPGRARGWPGPDAGAPSASPRRAGSAAPGRATARSRKRGARKAASSPTVQQVWTWPEHGGGWPIWASMMLGARRSLGGRPGRGASSSPRLAPLAVAVQPLPHHVLAAVEDPRDLLDREPRAPTAAPCAPAATPAPPRAAAAAPAPAAAPPSAARPSPASRPGPPRPASRGSLSDRGGRAKHPLKCLARPRPPARRRCRPHGRPLGPVRPERGRPCAVAGARHRPSPPP